MARRVRTPLSIDGMVFHEAEPCSVTDPPRGKPNDDQTLEDQDGEACRDCRQDGSGEGRSSLRRGVGARAGNIGLFPAEGWLAGESGVGASLWVGEIHGFPADLYAYETGLPDARRGGRQVRARYVDVGPGERNVGTARHPQAGSASDAGS